MDKSIELQKQARENALEVGAYVKGLEDWAQEMKQLEQNTKTTQNPPTPHNKEDHQPISKSKPSYHPKRERQALPVWDMKNWTKLTVPEITKESSASCSATQSNPKVNGLKEKGNQMFAKGNYSKAIEFYTQALELTQSNAALYSNRAQCYLNLSKYSEAEADADLALKIDRNQPKALFRRSKARMGKGDYSRAKTDLLMLLYLDSNNSAISGLLSSIKDKEGGSVSTLQFPTNLSDEPLPVILKDGQIINEQLTNSKA